MAVQQTVLEVLLQLKDEATAGMKKFTSSFGEAEKASKTFGLGILAAGAGAVAFGVMAVKAAGEAEAQLAGMNATLETMGTKGTDAKEAILKMSESAVKLGFDDEDAAVSIAKLYQRTGDLTQAGYLNATAMDLARAKHMDLTTAGNLVGLVLSGNGKLLKQYGIDLKDAATPMEAITELHDKLAGQADAYASTWEGNMAILSVVFGNLKETVGQYILPLLTDFLQKGIIPLIEQFGAWSSDIRNINNWLKEHQTVIWLVVGAVVGALIPALWGMATAAYSAAAGMIAALWPFALIGAAIAGLVLGILWVVKNWDLIKEKTFEVWNAISGFLVGIWNGIKRIVSEVWNSIKGLTTEVWNSISSFLTGVWNGIIEIVTITWNVIKDIFSAIWEGIKTVFIFAAQLIVGAVIAIFAAFGIDIVAVFNQVKDYLFAVWEGIKTTFNSSLEWIKQICSQIWAGISTTATAIFDKLKLYFDVVWTAIKLVFNTTLEWIKKTWNEVWGAVGKVIGPIWEGIKTVIGDAWNFIMETFKAFTEPLNKAWTSLWSGVGQTLKDVWDAVKNTIKDSINWILEKVNSVISAMNSVAAKGASVIGTKAIQIPTIPLLAEGGIVNQPTLAMIGEAGPEAVIPLSKMNSFSGGTNITINISGNNINSDLDIRNLADTVSDAIMSKLRLNSRISI